MRSQLSMCAASWYTIRVIHEHRRPWYAQPWLHVAVILLVAAAFRLWQISSLPPGLFGDEATDGLDALDVLAGRGAVFFPANYGREGLHMWIVALAFRLFGVTPLALRLPSALAGILTALATYWLGRELFVTSHEVTSNKKDGLSFLLITRYSLPLLAALYLATSYWHVHFSRFGIRGVFTPLCGALAFAAFWRGVNRRSYAWFAAAGLCLGLATHFYTASRFFPFFLAGFLVVQWVAARLTHGEALLPRHWRRILLMFAVAAVVFAPLGLYFLQHPGSFSQRASAVTAFGSDNPLLRMAQAALANVLQFFVPGKGDLEQFYNLPGRAVFDVLTALLALVGVAALLWRWRQGPALFLLLWFPALLLPSFLATDRWPTLPRVLGVIPGVYFFPAVGLATVAGWLMGWGRRGFKPPGWQAKPAEAGSAHSVSASRRTSPASLVTLLPGALLTAALLLHAGLTYRDYFRVWGPSQATFDAFEGDMVAAADWLDGYEDARVFHVYLSSDIYRHPTFMLLHEHATVQTYFTHTNLRLSWFDARSALPLPVMDPTVYLIPASAPLTAGADARLRGAADRVDVVTGPGGAAALTVYTLPPGARLLPEDSVATRAASITPQLTLAAAEIGEVAGAAPRLALLWRTGGRDAAEWPGYRLEVELPATDGSTWSTSLPFDAFRSAEWTVAGAFLTWHTLDGFRGDLPAAGRLRLVRVRDGQPVTTATAADGWHDVSFTGEGIDIVR